MIELVFIFLGHFNNNVRSFMKNGGGEINEITQLLLFTCLRQWSTFEDSVNIWGNLARIHCQHPLRWDNILCLCKQDCLWGTDKLRLSLDAHSSRQTLKQNKQDRPWALLSMFTEGELQLQLISAFCKKQNGSKVLVSNATDYRASNFQAGSKHSLSFLVCSSEYQVQM